MLRGEERGKESPMELDSPPAIWCNSPVPLNSSGEKSTATAASTPRVVFGLPASSPKTLDSSGGARPCTSPVKSLSKIRKFGGLFSAANVASSPTLRMRSSPLARKSKFDTDSPLSNVSSSSAKKKRHIEETGGDQERHLYLPLIIMGYIQVAFNVILISAVLYFLLQFFLTVRRDVQIKVDEQLSNIMTEITQCSKQYVENRCSPELRVPAMEKSCLIWESCMKRDPSVVGRAKLSAETFAEIINGFIEPISYKTMIFILTALFGTIFLSNYAFTMARNRVTAGYQFINTSPSTAGQLIGISGTSFAGTPKSGMLALQ